MIKMIDVNQCCGCGNCAIVCSKEAIQLKLNDDGFWYPCVDKNKCIKCGACSKYCPVINDDDSFLEEFGIHGYFGRHKDVEVLKSCSSGGIATALAEYVIAELNGIVYGAAYAENFSYVKTVRIDKLEDLEQLKGSKYIQCLKFNIFKSIKDDLENGKNVLYIALPCDIAALMQYLKKKYDLLYTVDMICHGPTSVFAFRDYLKIKVKKEKIIKFSMRYKKDSNWTPYYLYIETDNKRIVTERFWSSDFGYVFNRFARKYCYSCRFKGPFRFSDLTIGDAWGAPETLIDNNNSGLSSIVVNTQKGLALLKNNPRIILYDTDVSSIINGNLNLTEKRKITKEWDYISKHLKSVGLKKTIKGLKPLKKRVLETAYLLKCSILEGLRKK